MPQEERRSHTPKGRASRDKVLRAAERLLAARGFHGTSMRDVADAAGVPLASALYHFARKERLHAAVLGGIGADLEARLGAALAAGDDFEARLARVLEALLDWCDEEPGRVRLLLRELLDNPTRVVRASRLPLAPVLRALAELVEEGVASSKLAGETSPETSVQFVVGALSYVVAAKPTVERIVGEARARKLAKGYREEALAFARRALGVGRA